LEPSCQQETQPKRLNAEIKFGAANHAPIGDLRPQQTALMHNCHALVKNNA